MTDDDSIHEGPSSRLASIAEDLAADLQRDMYWAQEDFDREYWTATDRQLRSQIRARAVAAIDFLDRFSGPETSWSLEARRAMANSGENQSMESGARAVGDLLRLWAEQVRKGRLVPRTIDALGVREVAATDLMEQVRTLNADRSMTPAAPIVLAGAALEIALRSAVEQLSLDTGDRPTITTYAKALRSADVLNKQDMKDVEQLAGLRNQAAHGNFDLLNQAGAGLMEQQVNLFLARLERLLDDAPNLASTQDKDSPADA